MHAVIIFKKFSFFFFCIISWNDNKQLFVVRRSRRQWPGLQPLLLCWHRRQPKEPLPQAHSSLPSGQLPATSRRSMARVQKSYRCQPAKAFLPCFNFKCMADSREDGYVLLQGSPFAEGSRAPSWTAKPAQGCVCWKRDQLPQLLSAPCCPSPTCQTRHNRTWIIRGRISGLRWGYQKD